MQNRVRFRVLSTAAIGALGLALALAQPPAASAAVDRKTCLAQCQTDYDLRSDKCRAAWLASKADDKDARYDRCISTIGDGLVACKSACPAK
jgi:hypothetical protein